MALSGYNFRLQMGDGATPTEAFANIPGLTDDIGTPTTTTDTIETTSRDSGGWKTFMNGLKDTDELSFTAVWDQTNAQHTAIRTKTGQTATTNFRIISSDFTDGWRFAGLITQSQVVGPMDDFARLEFTIKPSGVSTFGPIP